MICGLWQNTRRKGWRKTGREKGKGGRMKARHIILNRCTFRPGKRWLEAFAFVCIWDKHDTAHPGLLSHLFSSSSGSKESTKPILGHVCYRCFGMRDIKLGEMSSWQEYRGWWRAWWVPDLPRCSPWHLLTCEGHPGTFTFSPKMQPKRACVNLLGWHLCTQRPGLAKSVISRHAAWKDKQKLWGVGL